MPERLILSSDDLSRRDLRRFTRHALTSRTIRFRDGHWSIRVPHMRIGPGNAHPYYRFELTRLPE